MRRRNVNKRELNQTVIRGDDLKRGKRVLLVAKGAVPPVRNVDKAVALLDGGGLGALGRLRALGEGGDGLGQGQGGAAVVGRRVVDGPDADGVADLVEDEDGVGPGAAVVVEDEVAGAVAWVGCGGGAFG